MDRASPPLTVEVLIFKRGSRCIAEVEDIGERSCFVRGGEGVQPGKRVLWGGKSVPAEAPPFFVWENNLLRYLTVGLNPIKVEMCR